MKTVCANLFPTVASKIDLPLRWERERAKVASRLKSTLFDVMLAAGCVSASLLLTQLLHSIFPTPLFFAAIVASTWYGGAISGVLAVLFSAGVLEFYFVPPLHPFTAKSGEFSNLMQFVAPALVTCWIAARRKDAESSLRQSRDELEFRVRERTSELYKANELLKQQIAERIRAEETIAKTQAELAHVTRVTTLGELAASIAHEVNQPLMAVVLNGDASLAWLARPQPNIDKAREALERIISEGNRAAEIIRRIRALFQKSPPQKAPVEVNELIGDIVTLTRREMTRNGISCALELAAGLPRVWGDRVQLQQVVLNLVMNGIEAMSGAAEHPRELLIRTERDSGNGVLISVRDSGCGLPVEQPERIFEEFFTTKPDGLGMGLSISRTIIEAHGGRLWAAGAGPGAILSFRLPAHGGAA